jgi:hypothetical protein
MLPAIYPGSYAAIVQKKPERVKTGSIVLVETDSGLRLHRFVRMDGSGVITRGDNNDQNDPPVNASRFLGVLVDLEQPNRAKRWALKLRRWSPHLSR